MGFTLQRTEFLHKLASQRRTKRGDNWRNFLFKQDNPHHSIFYTNKEYKNCSTATPSQDVFCCTERIQAFCCCKEDRLDLHRKPSFDKQTKEESLYQDMRWTKKPQGGLWNTKMGIFLFLPFIIFFIFLLFQFSHAKTQIMPAWCTAMGLHISATKTTI
ncbi:hypothetical protein SKAU_G00114910 [Synaphobranchus kaupii]|uniref:Uncharacterized protein n=1 Tax=Synaphobranchus kaupii TaxID=118154 RepID=A0A9Q1J1W3_SYNKA|nr:hypothetical protein SKAU_G00114910 [Synaphobranchus kaupii]